MFSSVVLDVDSTLCGIEGIDFLAERRGAELGAHISRATALAMSGEMPLEKVYGERLKLIQPSRSDVAALSEAYVKTLAPDAAEAILALREAKVGVTLVSGGIWQAIQPVARKLGLGDQDLNAVSLFFDDGGRYAGFDARSPLTRQTGKAEVLRELLAAHRLKQPVLAVGDGATDTFMRGVADRFAAFTGFARRESVVAQADLEIGSFAELERVVLGLGAS